MTTTDDLDTLTDDQLNERFAVEVAGWKRGTLSLFNPTTDGAEGWIDDQENYHRWPSFCADANAVLPWCQKWVSESGDVDFYSGDGYWQCTLWDGSRNVDQQNGRMAKAPTFARAAVLALLRAKRASQ